MNDGEESDRRLSARIGRKEARRLRARARRRGAAWNALGLYGVVGWSIVLPTLAGIALGVWIDRRWPSRYSWTLMLLAAGLLITTTIRLSALSRRRETTIMRMVGSSRTLIQAPFLLEGAVAATLGAVLAVGALYASVRYVVGDWLRASLTWIPYIGEADVLAVAPYLIAIAVALAAAASVVTLGKYTRA